MEFLEEFTINPPFRGSRNYVHSASVCNELVSFIGSCSGFKLMFRKLTKNRLVFSSKKNSVDVSGVGSFEVRCGGSEQTYLITEDLRHPIREKTPYNESKMFEHFEIMGSTVYSPGWKSDFSFFDRVVAANKYLIHKTIDGNINLIVGSIDLAKMPDTNDDLRIEILQHRGSSTFKTAIFNCGNFVGEVVLVGG